MILCHVTTSLLLISVINTSRGHVTGISSLQHLISSYSTLSYSTKPKKSSEIDSSSEREETRDPMTKTPIDGKKMAVRQLKKYYASSGGSQIETSAATDSDGASGQGSSRPESSRPVRTQEQQVIYNKLMELKQRLDADQDILISEQTMKVLQERQHRRDSTKSAISAHSLSPEVNQSPSTGSQPIIGHQRQSSLPSSITSTTTFKINPQASAKEEQGKKTEVKKLASTPRESPISRRSDYTEERSESESSSRPTSARIKAEQTLEAKMVGGRIFVQNKLKSRDQTPTRDLQNVRERLPSPRVVKTPVKSPEEITPVVAPKHQLPIRVIRTDEERIIKSKPEVKIESNQGSNQPSPMTEPSPVTSPKSNTSSHSSSIMISICSISNASGPKKTPESKKMSISNSKVEKESVREYVPQDDSPVETSRSEFKMMPKPEVKPEVKMELKPEVKPVPPENMKPKEIQSEIENRKMAPSFVRMLESVSFFDQTGNLILPVSLEGFPRPTLSLFKNGVEMKINWFRLKRNGNDIEVILFPEFWKHDAILTILATNEVGECSTESIVYPHSLDEEPTEEQKDEAIFGHSSDGEIDSSDISDLARELRMEVQNNEEDEDEEDYLPRELSPIFEVTEDEYSITHSIRSGASSRRSSIRSIDSIRSTLTVLTPTQSVVVKSPPVEVISVTGTTVSPNGFNGIAMNGIKHEGGYHQEHHEDEEGIKTPTPEDNMAHLKTGEGGKGARRGSFQSINSKDYDDDVYSIDSYATVDGQNVDVDEIDTKYRSTEELMSFVTRNFVTNVNSNTETETETETEAVMTPTTVEETVASPSNVNLFPTPTDTVRNASPNSSVHTLSTMNSGNSGKPDEEKTRFEELLHRQMEVRRQVREKVHREMNIETTTSDTDGGIPAILTNRRHRKMNEEERQKKERKMAFQQKYRLTQRFIEDSIKGNATSIELTQRAMKDADRMCTPVSQASLLNDSDVFLDTDDDGMDTVSEVTIDFGRQRDFGDAIRDEFNSNLGFDVAYGENYIDL